MATSCETRRLRPGLPRFAALLLVPSLSDALAIAEEIDVRDLNEWEVAHLEGVSRPDGQELAPPWWRTTVPQPGVRYPVRQWLEWRETGLRRRQEGRTRFVQGS
jgi:hypothetical protein